MASDPPCPAPFVLKQLLDGIVPEAEQARLQGHLETCAACQQRLQQLAAGGDSWAEAVQHLGAEPPRGEALRQAMERLRDKDQLLLTQDEADGHEEISLSFLDPPAKPRQLGKLDHYEIIEVIGRGGMGIVFKALDPTLHRIVAVKVMVPQLATLPVARQRFLREARAAAAVCHEHVVTIHAVAEVKGLPYLVMQFVAGMSLQDRLERRGPLNLDEILRIGMQTAQGLAAAHAQGLVHRDIKPANILLENGVERVKITDFGLARAGKDASITQSGVVVGTPQYMAPEQARGEAVDPRADLFSLGSVLYFMCTGQPPFQGDSSLAVLRQVCDDTPPPIAEINPSTPDWLVEIIARLQAKEPDERFQSATEVAELLGEHYARLQQSRSQPTIRGETVSEAASVAASAIREDPAEERTSEPAKAPGKSRWPLALGISTAVVILLLCCGGVVIVPVLGFLLLSVEPRMELMQDEISASAEPAPPPPAPPAVDAGKEALARQVRDKLTTYCYRCHGENGAMEGGFNYLMDRRQLIAHKKIVPGKPEWSRLLQRIVEGEMPPEDETKRPNEADIALLRRWIEAGAPDFNPPSSEKRDFLAHADVIRSIRADLEKRPERDRPYLRYFTLTHLHNAGLSEDELQSYRNGVAKLLNSLSWRRDILVPVAVDSVKTILRIDLRDYLWTEEQWDALLAEYPYGPKGGAARRLPMVRGDWFVTTAARPPLYHQLLGLPDREAELEKLLHVNVEANIRAERVARAGFRDSGVSHYNRLIERHESSYGAYWKSYDFAGTEGANDIFARPLGPGAEEHCFRHAGSEIIFNLPNGLQGYMLADATGKRLDKAPTAIVSDPRRPDRAVENGLSCMSCHSGGIIPKADRVRDNVEKNPQAFSEEESKTILALYPPAKNFTGLQERDAEHFRKAVEATGGRVEKSEPIAKLAARFEAPVDLKQAAAEVGLSTAQFQARMNDSSAELLRTLGPLKSSDGTVPRQTFAAVFADILDEWKLDTSAAPLLELTANHPGREAEDATPSDSSASAIPKIAAPSLDKSKVEVPLSEPFAQVRTGGGGRYLVFHLKKAKKLAIFDVTAVKVVKEIELPTEDIVYACGRDKLMIVLPGQRIIWRWSLRTFQREKTAPVPDDRPVLKAAMGSHSHGPLLLWTGGKVVFFDVERMEPFSVEGEVLNGGIQWGLELRASADGQTFIGWTPGLSPMQYSVMRLAEHKATMARSPDGHGFNGHWAMPNADASLFFRHKSGLYSADMKILAADGFKDAVLLPTEDPRFFLALRQQTKDKDQVTICSTADRREILTLPNLEKMTGSSLYTNWGLIGGEPRIHYLPAAHVLLTLPESNNRVVVRSLNLLAALDKEKQNYLFVLSVPPMRVRSGMAYDYRLDVHSKAGGVRCKLEAGPEGMTISPGGRLRWQVPLGHEGRTINVIVTIRDASGKGIQHSFEVVVE
ncbi:MAG TPA: protein kinase [Gemmataceae bacterium]|jgi:serine/threonine protein kinase